jgi:hypothetical protein
MRHLHRSGVSVCVPPPGLKWSAGCFLLLVELSDDVSRVILPRHVEFEDACTRWHVACCVGACPECAAGDWQRKDGVMGAVQHAPVKK